MDNVPPSIFSSEYFHHKKPRRITLKIVLLFLILFFLGFLFFTLKIGVKDVVFKEVHIRKPTGLTQDEAAILVVEAYNNIMPESNHIKLEDINKPFKIRQFSSSDNKSLYLVSLTSGEAQDCPSGCIWETHIMLIDHKKNVYDFSYRSSKSISLFLERNKNLIKYYDFCFSYYWGWDVSEYKDHFSESILKRKGHYYWVQTYDNYKRIRKRPSETQKNETDSRRREEAYYGKTGCVFNGSIITKPGFMSSASSKLIEMDMNVETILPDCNKLTNKRDSYRCLSDLAVLENNLDICKDNMSNFGPVKYLDECLYEVAVSRLDEKVCQLIERTGITKEPRPTKENCIEEINKIIRINKNQQ